jgi:hypothetical protein
MNFPLNIILEACDKFIQQCLDSYNGSSLSQEKIDNWSLILALKEMVETSLKYGSLTGTLNSTEFKILKPFL